MAFPSTGFVKLRGVKHIHLNGTMRPAGLHFLPSFPSLYPHVHPIHVCPSETLFSVSSLPWRVSCFQNRTANFLFNCFGSHRPPTSLSGSTSPPPRTPGLSHLELRPSWTGSPMANPPTCRRSQTFQREVVQKRDIKRQTGGKVGSHQAGVGNQKGFS